MKQNSTAKSFLLSAIILIITLTAGIVSVISLARYEQQRDLNDWQLTLSVMADSKSSEIAKWTDGKFAVLQELAANGSLQMYVQQLLRQKVIEGQAEAVQLSYLRNLIKSTGARSGFFDEAQTNIQVPANIAFHADNGLTLLAADKKVIISTPGFYTPDSKLAKQVSEVLTTGKHRFAGIYLNENKRPVVGFLVPVFALQKQSDVQSPIAVLYGFTHASTSLFKILDSKTSATKSAETILVAKTENLISYISPLADGSKPLSRSLSANDSNLVASLSVSQPGTFDSGLDYSGEKCLFTSRDLAGLNMTLIQKIAEEEALAESNSHRRFLLIALLLALLLGGSLMVAAWWYGSSIKERKAAQDLLRKSKQLQAQTNLLNAINDNMTDFTLLLDHQSQLIFANKALADLLQVPVGDLQGKTLSNLFGPNAAKKFQHILGDEDTKTKVVSKELTIDIKGELHLFYVSCLQVAYEWKHQNSILVTLSDVTKLQQAQIKKDRLMKQIVSSLMRAIDLHDPYSANHSAKTASVALAIGNAMGLKTSELTTIEIAASLCNLGKLSIPRNLLLKTGKLSDAEQEILKSETTSASEILTGIDFEVPVLKTISQKHEYLDGSGSPDGLAGDEIILTARILSAANAFVAMTSPRAYRDKLTNTEAMDQLLKASESKYDRHVIAALFHVVENERSKGDVLLG